MFLLFMKLKAVRISYTSNDAACPANLTVYHTLDKIFRKL